MSQTLLCIKQCGAQPPTLNEQALAVLVSISCIDLETVMC